MRKGTQTVIIIWDDQKALAFTRYLNRAYLPDTAHLDGARIEVCTHISQEHLLKHLEAYNDQDFSYPIVIEEKDITWRNADAPFIDLYLTDTPKQNQDRIAHPVDYQTNSWR